MNHPKYRASSTKIRAGLYIHACTFVPANQATTFPFDMLRYDECFPDSSEDALSMSFTEPGHAVTLRKRHANPNPEQAWTFDRWRSFGWKPLEKNNVHKLMRRKP